MADTDPADLLADITERWSKVAYVGLRPEVVPEPGHQAEWLPDVAHLLAAVEAVLGLAAGAVPSLAVAPADCTDACDSGPCTCSGIKRPIAWNLDPAKVRKAITCELLGKESR